ncbi:hypothetical protein [Kriegella aquimaris]|uniref:Uncharacterized protein n=1 Tax=Kriegella aquimaris TaxID=192904 RepID=A0A1G9VUZ7_9FLAO|nr:hypothetical protein [Kriegella aquimaris]SDM75715.1 hypothetical protein SAMN04488514_11456 [Kriegella aquimaris]
MKSFRTYLITSLVLVFLLNSCMEEQNFDQYEDLRLRPTYEASILYIEASERAIDAASSATFFSRDFNFDAFSESVFSERVRSGIITYEVENTTNQEFDEILVEFLDEAGNVLYTESFYVPPAPTAVLQREITFGPGGENIDIIRNTSSFRVSATIGADSSTSTLSDPKITLKSSGKFTVALK